MPKKPELVLQNKIVIPKDVREMILKLKGELNYLPINVAVTELYKFMNNKQRFEILPLARAIEVVQHILTTGKLPEGYYD